MNCSPEFCKVLHLYVLNRTLFSLTLYAMVFTGAGTGGIELVLEDFSSKRP
jgi:hypothetical protein